MTITRFLRYSTDLEEQVAPPGVWAKIWERDPLP